MSETETAPFPWVSVTERLPTDERDVLIYGDWSGGKWFAGFYDTKEREWWAKNSFKFDAIETQVYGVTHWAYVPPPQNSTPV